jgi:GNAT superfamily N-acetyltransferase
MLGGNRSSRCRGCPIICSHEGRATSLTALKSRSTRGKRASIRGARAAARADAAGRLVLARALDSLVVGRGSDGPVYRLDFVQADWRGRGSGTGDYAHGLFPDEAGRFLIADLFVHERSRGRGRGTLLVRGCIELATRLGARAICGNLSLVDDVERLERFYRRLGFDVALQRTGSVVGLVSMDLGPPVP